MDSDVMKAARKALSVWTEARMRERIAEKLAKTYRDAGFTHALMRVALAGIEAATQPDPWTTSGAEWDHSMHQNPRADAWGKAFVRTFPGLADKEDVMVGWFANAMMAMHDHVKGIGPLNGDMAEALQEAATQPAEAEVPSNAEIEACRECDGTGAVTCTGPTGEFADQWQEPCPECSVDEKDELRIERERHAEVIDDLQRKIRVVAKERERAEQAERGRDAARKALRGLVEATEAVEGIDTDSGDAKIVLGIAVWMGKVRDALRAAREVLT